MKNNWPTNPSSRTQSVHYPEGVAMRPYGAGGARKLGELVDFLDNQRKPISDEERQKRIGPYPYYGANGQVGWIDDFIFDEDLVLLAEDGGYFGSKDRPIAYRISGKSWVNNHAHVLRVKRGIAETDFIHYRLMFYDIKPYITGSTRTKLNKSAAEKIKIPLPPLEIQKQIVERLDKVVAAQKLNDDLIQKSDELFQSLLHKELNPAGKDWEAKKLGEVCEELFAGGDAPKNNFSKIKTEKYFIPIFANGIEGKDLYGYTDIKKVTKPSITISARGTIGYSVLRKEAFYPIVRLIVLIPNSKIIDLYFLYYATCNFKFFNTGTSIPQLTIPMIENIKIPLPLLEIQEQIVAKLSAVQEYKTGLIAQRKKLKELFDSVLSKSMHNK